MSRRDTQKLIELVLPCDRQTNLPDGETWEEMIARVLVENAIHEINDDTYFYFLDVLPPKWFNGNLFAFGEGQEPLRLYCRNYPQYFCRQLTEDQTDQFCQTVGLPKTYGSL
jgi:hypothetical protein